MGCSLALGAVGTGQLADFQYPQSGSMGCSMAPYCSRKSRGSAFSIPKADRWAAASPAPPPPSATSASFSIPKADRWAAACLASRAGCGCSSLSVSPKRIDGLQLASPGHARPGPVLPFQYPQSGSMGCSEFHEWLDRGERAVLSVSPKRIDGLQPP